MINKHNLAVAEFAAKEAGYCSPDVRFTAADTIATNGRYLVRVSNVDNGTIQTTRTPFSIPADALKGIKVKKGDSVELATNGTGSSWNLTTGSSTVHLEESSASFPDVDAVMPTDEPVITFGCDPTYLAKLAKAFAAFEADERNMVIKVSVWTPEKAIRIEATNGDGQTMTALLMPRRLQ